jgi:Flp pilus assembly protein TadG
MFTCFHRFRKTEKGQALVEMALVLPILILIVFGITEFGRIFNAKIIVINASREGARYAAVNGTAVTDTQITDKVKNSAPSLDPLKMTVNVNPVQGARTRGAAVAVAVYYPVEIVAPVISVFTGNPYIVNAQTTMRVE